MQVKTDGRDVTDTGVAVDPNENVIVDVRLTRHPTEISGRVVTRERVEDGSCRVIVFSEESQRWSWPASRYVKAVHVGADDRFEMKGLPAGKYLVIAVRRLQGEVWRDPDYLRQLASDAKRFELREAESKSLDVPLKSTRSRPDKAFAGRSSFATGDSTRRTQGGRQDRCASFVFPSTRRAGWEFHAG
jgi:hypothetical protein